MMLQIHGRALMAPSRVLPFASCRLDALAQRPRGGTRHQRSSFWRVTPACVGFIASVSSRKVHRRLCVDRCVRRRSLSIAARASCSAGQSAGDCGQPTVRLHFFSDAAFRPLRDQFVDTLVDSDFELCESYVDDLGVNPNRAAGGVPVYIFKTQLLLDALEAIQPGEVCVVSDIDIQFFREVLPYVREGIVDRDVCFQQEFASMGVNIGFMALRRTDASLAFWREVLRRIHEEGSFDQRIVNTLLYTGFADDIGLRWGRFPASIWASTQGFDGPPLDRSIIALHHANWVVRDATTYAELPAATTAGASAEGGGASNPMPKMAQLRRLRQLVLQSSVEEHNLEEEMKRFVADFAADPALALYYRRSFGDQRCGPEWTALPQGHPARPGGSRRQLKRRLQQEQASDEAPNVEV